MNKRIALSILTGAILGIFCILGASVRIGWQGNQHLIFSLWYNRLIMGLLIGLAGNLVIIKRDWNWVLRGASLGLVVSAAYFFTSGAVDWVSLFAGVVYGVIIEFVLKRFAS
ncbi:MAG TPA: hypothetical protein ENF22_00105 [Chloroflexi bacterium]|nr:hypothetical protein [Chloroflexota bacterium]